MWRWNVYVPALTDFTLMEEKEAKLFVNSPNAIPGNDISKCDTSSAADYRAKEAGLVDFKGSEEDDSCRDPCAGNYVTMQTTKMICLTKNAQMI